MAVGWGTEDEPGGGTPGVPAAVVCIDTPGEDVGFAGDETSLLGRWYRDGFPGEERWGEV